MSRLQEHIRRLRRRVRLLLMERYVLIGGATGALISAVLVVFAPYYDQLLDYRLWIGVVVSGILLGAAYGLLRRLDDLSVALAADRRTGFKERLSTAVAISDTVAPDEFEQALINDASIRVQSLRASEIFGHKFGKTHGVFAASLAVLLAVIMVPQLPYFHSKERKEEIAVMKREGAKLVKIAKDIKKNTPMEKDEMQKLAQRLEQLGRKMETGRMQKKRAMLKMQQLANRIEDQQDKLAQQNPAKKSMHQAQVDMRKASADLAKKMADRIADKKNIPPAEAMKQIPSDEKLAQLARKEGPLTENERKELAEAIEKYANPGNNAAIPAELGEALAKLAENEDFRKASELMKKLSEKLASGKMSEVDEKMLKEQLEQLAKALQDTDLDKLAKQMLDNAEKLAQMSDEELEQMLKELEEMQQMAEMLAKAGGG